MAACNAHKARRRWPRAAILALGIAGGCLSTQPPSVPPGWTIHYHQETPYFYNENTGETTWDPPIYARAPAPTTTPEQDSSSGKANQPSRREAPREISSLQINRPTQHTEKKRGWFGFGRRAAKPVGAGTLHSQVRLQDRAAAGVEQGLNEYSPTEGLGGRGNAVGGPRSQELWQGADKATSSSDPGREGTGVGLQHQHHQHHHQQQQWGGDAEVPDGAGFREEGQPAGYKPRQGRPASAAGAWRRAGAGPELWEPMSGAALALRGQGEGSAAADGPANEGVRFETERFETEGSTSAGEGRGVRADNGEGGLGTSPAATGTAGASSFPSDNLGESRHGGSGGRDDAGLWAGSPAEAAAVAGVVGIENAKQAGGEVNAAGVGLIPPNEGAADGVTEGESQSQQEQLQKGEQAAAAAAAQASTAGTAATEERSAPPPAAAMEAAAAEDPAAEGTFSEWFLPPPAEEQRPNSLDSDSAWGKEYTGGSREEQRESEAGGKGSVADEGGSPGSGRGFGANPATGGRVGGTDASQAQGGQAWGARYQSQPNQQQEQRGAEARRQEAEGWDWADPWGQGDGWGGAAWGSGAHGTLPDPPRGSDPFSNTPSSSAFDPPTGRPAGGGSGWGFDEVKHDGGVGFAGAGADGDVPAMGAARGQEEDLARALAEARKELEEAREAAEILRVALKAQEEAKASAVAAATAAQEEAEEAQFLVQQQAQEAKDNATAVGQLLVRVGLEQEEMKGKLAAAQSNSTSLAEEVAALEETVGEVELRANSSEGKLKAALEDMQVLDEGLKLYMDGDGRDRSPRQSPLTWRRVSQAYLRPLLPSKLKAPTPEELEAVKLNRSLGRALENNTALAEAVKSKDDLVKDLNLRIKQFQFHAVRRRKGYRTLKLGLAELTREVQAKESMMTILAVCMFGTSSILEGMSSTLHTQHADIAALALLLVDREAKERALALEAESNAARLADVGESLHRAESALSAVATSLGVGEDAVQRWKVASGGTGGTGDEDPLAELLHELHVAAAAKFINPLGLEPFTGAITVAVPQTAMMPTAGQGAVRGRKSPGFWGGVLAVLCCRRPTRES